MTAAKELASSMEKKTRVRTGCYSCKYAMRHVYSFDKN